MKQTVQHDCEISEYFEIGKEIEITWKDGTVSTETIESIETSNERILVTLKSESYIGSPPAISFEFNNADRGDATGYWVCVDKPHN